MAIGLEEEIAAAMADEIAAQMDWEVVADLLVSIGWTKVIRSPWFDNEDVADIKDWIETNRTGNVSSLGNTWLFEKEQDAIMFSLRWL